MEIFLLPIIFVALYFLILVLSRFTDFIPHLIFYITSRDEINYLRPNDLRIEAELITISKKQTSVNAWFFTSDINSDKGILMIPSWFEKDHYISSLKIADFLKKAGYNVLLPIYHPLNTKQSGFDKRIINPKICHSIIQMSYEYFIKRDDIDKRKIGVYSNSIGLALAAELIKSQPIKAIVIEDGPVSLWDKLASELQLRNNIPLILSKILFLLLLGPFLWNTKWTSRKTLDNIRACPTFLIITREDQTIPKKQVWKTYKRLYKPHQFWFEHALVPGGIRDTWPKEYSFQINPFYDHWLIGTPETDYHFDFKVKHRKKGKIPIEVQITAMPPQLSNISLQILLSDKNGKMIEARFWFTGASMSIALQAEFKPDILTVLPFYNVESIEGRRQQWYKKNSEEALNNSIIQLTNYPYDRLGSVIDRYYFLKGILLKESGSKVKALDTIKTRVRSKFWKNEIKYDSDSRKIFDMDSHETFKISSSDLFSVD
jgi:hypothetical protein